MFADSFGSETTDYQRDNGRICASRARNLRRKLLDQDTRIILLHLQPNNTNSAGQQILLAGFYFHPIFFGV